MQLCFFCEEKLSHLFVFLTYIFMIGDRPFALRLHRKNVSEVLFLFFTPNVVCTKTIDHYHLSQKATPQVHRFWKRIIFCIRSFAISSRWSLRPAASGRYVKDNFFPSIITGTNKVKKIVAKIIFNIFFLLFLRYFTYRRK